MRIIAKILAIPFILALTLVVAALSFLAALGGWLFSVAASILGLMGLLTLVMGGGAYAGIGLLVMAFLVSPYGIPAVAEINYGIRIGNYPRNKALHKVAEPNAHPVRHPLKSFDRCSGKRRIPYDCRCI